RSAAIAASRDIKATPGTVKQSAPNSAATITRRALLVIAVTSSGFLAEDPAEPRNKSGHFGCVSGVRLGQFFINKMRYSHIDQNQTAWPLEKH
ncbi:MAG: hypothetical protein WBF73_36560, partial [Bradyrhizobium sp.]